MPDKIGWIHELTTGDRSVTEEICFSPSSIGKGSIMAITEELFQGLCSFVATYANRGTHRRKEKISTDFFVPV
jgi:hypothetical protein